MEKSRPVKVDESQQATTGSSRVRLKNIANFGTSQNRT